ncbi:leucine-rich repeat-containing 70 [Brachionus plicatilis]|uniref:Leucine-rich repeat-containing 70 n=1 Tax=Brachionus plicatilis TaxID=10195 RepID=A0A3M7PMS7_BRAPC|nr:leucine-rich repeat-containing 70 [Brachionus plicatilis]
MAKFFFIQTIFVFLTSSAVTKCPYYIDIFNCVNINCNGKMGLTQIVPSIADLVHYEFKPDNLLCSLDLSNSGITEISARTIGNLAQILDKLAKKNPKQKSTIIKISFSNINRIKQLNIEANLAFFIYDSQVRFIESKSFENLKLELYLMNVNFTILNWINLLNEAKLKLLNIREIQVSKSVFYDLEPIGIVSDLKLYNTFMPILDEQYFLFPLIESVEQLEIVNCSVQEIRSSFFKKFKKLKYLTLSSNSLTRVEHFMFEELDELEFLDLDTNPIEYIHPKAFTWLTKLRTLSINLNFIKFSLPDYQWMYNCLELTNLNDFSLRNPKLISNFCSLYQIVNYLNRINQNLVANKFDLEAYHNFINDKRFKLFGYDQISLSLDVLFKDKHLFCSVYFVCIYAKNYSSAYLNAWSLEYFDVCPEVLSLNDNIEFICEFHLKVGQCAQSLEVKSQSDSNLIDQTHQNSILTIIKKYTSKNSMRNRFKRRRKQNWPNDSLDSGYYIVLMNKKHVQV